MTKNYDVVVVGSGPGGYVCAIRCAQLGLNVAIVERENLGGICLNWGCIPTKALLKAAEVYETIQHASDFGIDVAKPKVNVKKLIERSRHVAGNLNKGIGFLMKKNKVDVFEGDAKFTGKTTLELIKNGKKQDDISFKNAVIATGARARQIPGVLEADGKDIWTYRDAMTPTDLPKSLLVIGSGAIGIEFASFYHALGVDVTVVEAMDRILPVEDADVSKLAEKSFKDRGMTIMTGAMTMGLKAGKNGVKASIAYGGKTTDKTFDKALIAVGIQGNVEGLGLEKLKVKTVNGLVTTDEMYRTNVENIYAIGDVCGRQALAHVASHEGIICAEFIAGKTPHAMDYENVPGCTYCTPQIASVGLTEAQAKERGHDVKVGTFHYQANGKAQAIGEEEGFVKTLFDAQSGELLGAHIIGAEATEMISAFVVARQLETTEEDFMHACLPHPTLSEMMGESVLDSQGRVINA